MTLVKLLQQKYNIQIVSVTEGITFDHNTPGSFFRAGLQLLLAEEDSINRSIKVKGGIYTAKAKEGRFVYKNAPFGYAKQGERKDRKLIINEAEAKVVRFIFDSYLGGTPLYLIKEHADSMGFDRKGNMAVERVLSNPIYAGLLRVTSYKEHAGGLFPGIHEPIINLVTWKIVQEKMKRPLKIKTVIDENIPLRGLLKCHCGQPLSGAPSRGKAGNYYYYYKCKHSKHNNISALKAHEQFLKICDLMSLSAENIKKIKLSCRKSLDIELKENQIVFKEKQKKLVETKQNLYSVEDKWIKNDITKETFERWSNLGSIPKPGD